MSAEDVRNALLAALRGALLALERREAVKCETMIKAAIELVDDTTTTLVGVESAPRGERVELDPIATQANILLARIEHAKAATEDQRRFVTPISRIEDLERDCREAHRRLDGLGPMIDEVLEYIDARIRVGAEHERDLDKALRRLDDLAGVVPLETCHQVYGLEPEAVSICERPRGHGGVCGPKT